MAQVGATYIDFMIEVEHVDNWNHTIRNKVTLMSLVEFQLAAGSTAGRNHRMASRNNQDSWHIAKNEQCTVAIVTDGCGSGMHSEVGAKLGVRLVCQAVLEEASAYGADKVNWRKVEMDVQASLHLLALRMGGDFCQTVTNYFLFTMVGVVLDVKTATFFAEGDGVIIVNSAEQQLGPYPGNMPPYLGYGLLGGWQNSVNPDELQIKSVCEVPLNTLDRFLIGCDGVAKAEKGAPPGLLDLCAEGAKLPGLSQTIGGTEWFWNEDPIYDNPEVLGRRLKSIAQDWPKASKQPESGLLADDTTMIVGRRTPIPA